MLNVCADGKLEPLTYELTNHTVNVFGYPSFGEVVDGETGPVLAVDVLLDNRNLVERCEWQLIGFCTTSVLLLVRP